VLSLVLNVLVGVPVKASVCHEQRLPFGNTNDHTLIWATPTGYSGSWEASIPDHVRRARDTHFSGKNRNRTKARWLTQVQDNSEWWVSWASLSAASPVRRNRGAAALRAKLGDGRRERQQGGEKYPMHTLSLGSMCMAAATERPCCTRKVAHATQPSLQSPKRPLRRWLSPTRFICRAVRRAADVATLARQINANR